MPTAFTIGHSTRSAEHPMAFTVGHSTRSAEELVALLRAHGVGGIADVRLNPGSRRHPHFGAEALAEWLPAAGIAYDHLRALGGRRRPRPDSPNTGWEVDAFRGYADHMATPAFADALGRLEALARARPTAVMCAEAQWWRCHRRLVADALVVRRWEVRHLGLGAGEPPRHELTEFAVVGEAGALTYPAPQRTLGV